MFKPMVFGRYGLLIYLRIIFYVIAGTPCINQRSAIAINRQTEIRFFVLTVIYATLPLLYASPGVLLVLLYIVH